MRERETKITGAVEIVSEYRDPGENEKIKKKQAGYCGKIYENYAIKYQIPFIKQLSLLFLIMASRKRPH